MTTSFVFRFNATDVKALTDQLSNAADYLLVTCGTDVVMVNGQPTASLVVEVEGFRKTGGTSSSVGKKAGCPIPPCTAG